MAEAAPDLRRLSLEIPMPAGTLRLEIARSDWPLERLCGFAQRRNPRRAFLIVSKVLGRHIPVRPAIMRAAARDLAARIPSDLPGPVLTVGLAETAVCLGQTVHSELMRLRGGGGLFLHSTRQQIDAPLLCRFEEPHSHASAHLVYRPADADLDVIRTLVLVDDEVSTGTTLANLAAAIAGRLPRLERIVVAALTDWSGGCPPLRALPHAASCASLLEGRFDWQPASVAAPAEPGFAAAAPRLGSLPSHLNSGRLGWTAGQEVAIPKYEAPAGRRLRIVGTGEFTFPPFLLAERLERAGHDVVVQATSRSPILAGGAIGSTLRFSDNYGTGVANFLYNADPADGRHTIVCHETPPGSVDPALIDALAAETLYFGDEACAP